MKKMKNKFTNEIVYVDEIEFEKAIYDGMTSVHSFKLMDKIEKFSELQMESE